MLDPIIRETSIDIKPVPENNSVRLTWPVQADASGYYIYGSFSPTNLRNKIFLDPVFDNTVLVPMVIDAPRDCYSYFWIAKNVQGQIRYLNTEPVSLENVDFIKTPHSLETELKYILETDQKYYIEEIRRRNKALVEDSGEDWHLYLRMWQGSPCPCLPEEYGQDIPWQPKARCIECFGTGYLGGYYPHITIKAVYSGMPRRLITFEDVGLRISHGFNVHMLWAPRIRKNDIFVRLSTGDRFLVTEISEDRTWRNVTLMQTLRCDIITQESILYQLNDDKIEEAYNKRASFGYARFGMTRFGLFG